MNNHTKSGTSGFRAVTAHELLICCFITPAAAQALPTQGFAALQLRPHRMKGLAATQALLALHAILILLQEIQLLAYFTRFCAAGPPPMTELPKSPNIILDLVM